MAINEDLIEMETKLTELIKRYEQYFIGLEKREPLPLRTDLDRLMRRYSNTPINNTMYKHKYNMLVARMNTYKEHWNRVLRLIEEGKYSRERFISNLHLQRTEGETHETKGNGNGNGNGTASGGEDELERILRELRNARAECNMPHEGLTRDMVAATIAKQKPVLAAQLGSDDISFRVVVENGKPKIKARLRSK